MQYESCREYYTQAPLHGITRYAFTRINAQ
jgi:hypothetical protein